ncbi:MAG: formylglycine-generating enzyme family protein [Pseudomonadota bacterium]
MNHSLRQIRRKAVILTAAALLGLGTIAGGAEPVSTNSLGMTFVRISGGSFMMGSPWTETDRGPSENRHEVMITKDYYLQTTEVTLGQWRAIMGSDFFGGRKGDDNTPVVRVSWFDAQEFIKKLNHRNEGHYRLPTEAEWEYAARAGTDSAYPWGETADCSRAMFSNNPLKSEDCAAVVQAKGLAVGQPAPVGQYPPNAWGLYDMAGNVWEWVADWYGPYDPDKLVDPTGPPSGNARVKRGGSWFKYGHYCRSANRNAVHPGTRFRTTGFRLVRTEAAN